MLLKLKNKTLLSMDKLLKEAHDKKGMPSHFVFEPKEAADFIRELKDNPIVFRKNVEIKQNDNDDVVDIRFLLKSELDAESMHLVVNKWFKKHISIFYQSVEIEVIRKKALDVPKPEFAVGKETDGWSTPDVPTPQGPLGEGHVLQPENNNIALPLKLPAPDLLAPVTGKIKAEPPMPPTPPPCRIIRDHTLSRCEKCGSSIHRKWGIFKIDGCIQPECENYYKK